MSAGHCNSIIENIHEKEFFNQKLYCRGVLELSFSGSDVMSGGSNEKNSKINEPRQAIPGLPADALSKSKRKNKSKVKPVTPDRSDFLRKYVDRSNVDDYEFDNLDTNAAVKATFSSQRDLDITPDDARRVRVRNNQ